MRGMAYPPKGHPDRPLRLAASSMLTPGVLALLLSTCVGVFTVPGMATGVTQLPPHLILLTVLRLLAFLVPGAGLVLCSVYLKRYRRCAAIVGLVLAAIPLAICLMALVGILWGLLTDEFEFRELISIPAAVLLLFVFAFAQLVVHLGQSFKAIRVHEQEAGHGFEPLPADDLFNETAEEAEEA